MWVKNFGLVLVIVCILNVEAFFKKKPNIVLILADDMGRNDVSIHGSAQIPTPNIDAIGYNGVVLNKHYTMHICTPSRTALLTGNYPIRSGMQGFPLYAGEPRSLPINMATIAEKLLSLGYNTHLIGKWHLGHQNRSVIPLGRGFQTHLGYWSGYVGYFDYSIKERLFGGFDLHRNHKPAFENNGTYATDLFTDEAINIIQNHNPFRPMFMMLSHIAPHTGKTGWDLEVPNPEKANKTFNYIQEPKRRLYAEMVKRLDTSVGKVVESLSRKGILHNTILLFMSDNGAQTTGFYQNFGSNWPLRGLKFTLFEGGVRNCAFIWSKLLKNKHYIENTVFHITDWLPTLYAAAGGNVSDLGKIDGINHWPLLTQGHMTKDRKDILLNIDEVNNFSGILSPDGQYKLIQGSFQNGIYDSFYGDSGRSNNTPNYDARAVLSSKVNQAILRTGTWSKLTEKIILKIRNTLEIKQLNAERNNLTCTGDYCMFDLFNDPTETTNILSDKPDIAKRLNNSLQAYRAELVPQRNKPIDPNADPKYCDGTWFTWLDSEVKCLI